MKILTDWAFGPPPKTGTWLMRSFMGEGRYSSGDLDFYEVGGPWSEQWQWRGLTFNPEAIEWTSCEDANGKEAQGWFIPPEGLAYTRAYTKESEHE